MAARRRQLTLRQQFSKAHEHHAALVEAGESHPTEPDPDVTVSIVSEYDLVSRQRDPEAIRKKHERAWRAVSDNPEV